MTKISLQELLDSLNTYLKVSEFKDYGPNGLQVKGADEIKKIAFSTSASLETILEAKHAGSDALIVHHGIFWDKDSRVLDGSVYEKVKVLIESKMSLIAYHLPLDAHIELGNNAMILKMLGASHLEHFETIGMRGLLHTDKHLLLQKVQETFHVKPHIPPCSIEKITKIAAVSGGGHSYIKKAKEMGFDAFISGTFDEWVWDYAIENNILFIPLGHYKSENFGIKALSDFVKKTFKVETLYLESSNPY